MPIDFSKLRKRDTSPTQSAARSADAGTQYTSVLDLTKAPFPLRWWKPDEETKNWEMDIVAYMVSNPKNPVVRNEGMIPGEDWHFHIPLRIHKRLAGSTTDMICLKSFGLPCPACDAFFEFHDEHNKGLPMGDKGRKDNPYSESPRSLMLVRPRQKNPKDEIFVFDAPAGLKPTPGFTPLLLAAANNTRNGASAVDFAHPETGAVVQFDTTAGAKKGHYPASNFGFRPRPAEEGMALWARSFPLDALLIIPTADEMKALVYGMPVEEEAPRTTQSQDSSRSTYHQEEADAPDTQETRTQHPAQTENPAEDGKWKAPETTKPEAAKETGDKDSTCPHGFTWGVTPIEDEKRECRTCPKFDRCVG